MEKILMILILFIDCTWLFYLLFIGLSKKRKRKNRIKDFIPQSVTMDEEEKNKRKNTIFQPMLAAMSKAFKGIKFSKKTEKMLMIAGGSMEVEEYFVLRLLCAFGIGTFLYMLQVPWYICLLSLVIGFKIPDFYMGAKGRKRIKLLSYQLIETLGIMSNSLRSGFSFIQTMQLIGKEMPDPIGPEFSRTVHEIGIGVTIEDAFNGLLERLPNKELEVVVRAILAQRKSGGNLAQLLDTMEETVRGRIKVLEELKTLTAQGKLSSVIITILPVFMALYLNFMNPEYFRPMLNHPLGITMLVAGSISILIGWIIIRKIVRIEV